MANNDNGALGFSSKTHKNCPFHVDHEKRIGVGEGERKELSKELGTKVPWPVFRLIIISIVVPLLAFGGTYLVILNKLGSVQTDVAVIKSQLELEHRIELDHRND